MIYDLHEDRDRQRFEVRVQSLMDKGRTVELKEYRSRTLNQNSYLHLILGWFASEYGESLDFVKEEYFKRLVNADLFAVRRTDRFAGEVETLRSTRELSAEQMSLAIDRFRDWASKEAGIYLPSAEEKGFLEWAEKELKRYGRL